MGVPRGATDRLQQFAGLQHCFLATARAGKSIATGPAVALQSSATAHSECKRSQSF